jgi:phage nucleotide-binding protein
MATTLTQNSKASTTKKESANRAAKMIKSVNEVNAYLKMCVYGRNKSGKTHFAGSSNLKTLIIDCEEKGTETLVGRDNIEVYELSRWEELDWIYWHLKANDHDFEVVAIDTVTMLSTLGLKWVLGDNMDPSADPLMPDRRHYGKLNMALSQAMINWRNLPLHVLFLAQERTETVEDETDEMATLSEIVPSLTKGPRTTLLGAVGTIGRIYTRQVTKKNKTTGKTVERTERRMLVGTSEKFAGGTRIKNMPRILVNPTLQGILDHRAKHGEVAPGEADPGTAQELD